MGLSYEEVLVDVVRFKYLCDEGFITVSTSKRTFPHQNDGFFRHLVECMMADTGIRREIVERGLIHAALHRGRLDAAFYEAVVAQLYA